ncbi:hypothetical protein KIN20_035965 [Parelaphostrongylus tenuis]|uniref:Uncharacterized protein n=1 Tax=Parelaphostrongylus tenuis TaxID=148309 RepID=A0AAD5RCC2_PARTN|nr:hypothetical protein KIN20_035965 [Parelaphostrongylus tenuis]
MRSMEQNPADSLLIHLIVPHSKLTFNDNCVTLYDDNVQCDWSRSVGDYFPRFNDRGDMELDIDVFNNSLSREVNVDDEVERGSDPGACG